MGMALGARGTGLQARPDTLASSVQRGAEIIAALFVRMEGAVALFAANRRGFFREEACVDCPVDCYCACDGADTLFDVGGALGQELVDVGEGVMMGVPLRVERELLIGSEVYASLSHKGVLVICVGDDTLQFTDLNDGRQVEIEVEGDTRVGFYDEAALLLTSWKPLREAAVEDIFNDPVIGAFRKIEGTSHVLSYTDVSLLHQRRVVYYPTIEFSLFSFNVDTRENKRVDVGTGVLSVASFTGISCGTRAVFYSNDDRCTYALNEDHSVAKVGEKQYCILTGVLPSASRPSDIASAVLRYEWSLVRGRNEVDAKGLVEFEGFYSVIRVYRDVFLAYDEGSESWVLTRIVVP